MAYFPYKNNSIAGFKKILPLQPTLIISINIDPGSINFDPEDVLNGVDAEEQFVEDGTEDDERY